MEVPCWLPCGLALGFIHEAVLNSAFQGGEPGSLHEAEADTAGPRAERQPGAAPPVQAEGSGLAAAGKLECTVQSPGAHCPPASGAGLGLPWEPRGSWMQT